MRLATAVVKSFLNRLLGLQIGDQNRIFAHFAAETEEKVRVAKQQGEYDDGVVDVRGSEIAIVGTPEVLFADSKSAAKTLHYVVETDRGISYAAACAMLDEATKLNGELARGDGACGPLRCATAAWGVGGAPRLRVGRRF